MDTERILKTAGSHSAIESQRESPYDSERESLLREAILDSLAPALINDREGQIVKSYSKTFEWIFDPEQHGFARWLSEGPQLLSLSALTLAERTTSPIFWISGSPGSGKSTLMRHIHQSPELLRLLRQWTSGKEVTIAAFFFWESGTVMQRSRAGLLRALVHQLLDRYPELLPSSMPDLWSHLWTASTVERVRLLAAWDEEELESILVRYFKIPGRPPTYLHIDGLDELEGDQKQLIGLIKRIATCGDIKICVSSRPWDIFDESFRDVPSLRLQDLTKDDMRRFVRGRLSSESRLAALLNEHPKQGRHLEEVLLQKAAGVFLWVSLAVADISRSIDSTKAYSVDDLQQQVENLPIGLNDFYRYRLIDHSTSSISMSRIFQFLRARQEIAAFTRDNKTSLTNLWEMSLLSEAISVNEIAEMQIRQLSDDDVESRCNETIDNVHHATASLVQVQQSDLLPKLSSGVTYIHRTVKDWLADPLVWKEILEFAPNVNPHLAHLRSVVLSFRLTTQKPRRKRTVLDWWSRVVLALTHARYIPVTTGLTCKLLDTLNDTLTWYYYPIRDPDPRVDHWARSYFGTLEERGQTPYEEPFIALAVKFGLVDYVHRHLALGRYQEPKVGAGKSILLWSTMYLLNRQSSLYPLASLNMVEVLLAYGFDPNHRAENMMGLGQKPSKKQKTPWEATLECVQQAQRRGWIDMEEQNMKRWTGILQTFLRHGADPRVEICATYKDKTESAIALMERVRDAHPCPALEEVCEDLRVRLNTLVTSEE